MKPVEAIQLKANRMEQSSPTIIVANIGWVCLCTGRHNCDFPPPLKFVPRRRIPRADWVKGSSFGSGACFMGSGHVIENPQAAGRLETAINKFAAREQRFPRNMTWLLRSTFPHSGT